MKTLSRDILASWIAGQLTSWSMCCLEIIILTIFSSGDVWTIIDASKYSRVR